jgi:hypothetical protein
VTQPHDQAPIPKSEPGRLPVYLREQKSEQNIIHHTLKMKHQKSEQNIIHYTLKMKHRNINRYQIRNAAFKYTKSNKCACNSHSQEWISDKNTSCQKICET